MLNNSKFTELTQLLIELRQEEADIAFLKHWYTTDKTLSVEQKRKKTIEYDTALELVSSKIDKVNHQILTFYEK